MDNSYFAELDEPIESKGSTIDDITGSAPFNAVLGAGDSLRNLLASTANIVPGVNIPMAKSSSGTAYKTGEIAGDIAGFLGGGEVLEGARGAAEAIPYLGKLAKSLAGGGLKGVARRAGGSAVYGAIEDPNNREEGAVEGVLSSVIPEVGLKAGGKALSAISPKKYTEKLQQAIADSLLKVKEKSKGLYGEVLEKVGHKPVVIKSLNPDTFKLPKSLRELYSKYQNEPTFENAHKLQSQLGSEDRELLAKDQGTRDRKSQYQDAKKTIQDHLDKLLDKHEGVKSKYQEANKHYRENYVPYSMIKKGIEKMPNTSPDLVIKKISQITKRKEFPTKILNNREYPVVPKEIEGLQRSLSKKVRNKTLAQILSGGIIGGTAAHSMGAPLLIDLLASGSAGSALPYLIKKIPEVSKSPKVANTTIGSIRKNSKPLIDALYKSILLSNKGNKNGP